MSWTGVVISLIPFKKCKNVDSGPSVYFISSVYEQKQDFRILWRNLHLSSTPLPALITYLLHLFCRPAPSASSLRSSPVWFWCPAVSVIIGALTRPFGLLFCSVTFLLLPLFFSRFSSLHILRFCQQAWFPAPVSDTPFTSVFFLKIKDKFKSK